MAEISESISESIENNATGPRRMRGPDGTEVEQHPLPDQIAAARYAASKRASRRVGFASRLQKLVPPGTD